MVHIFVINSMIAPADFSQNLRASLAKHDELQYHVFNTSGAGMEEDIVRRMIRYFEGQQLRFYCCGGSGTMRNILQGAEGNDNIEFAFCPLGRTNDFLKVFGEGIELFKDIEKLIQGERIKVDYIKTNYGVALNTVSLGIDTLLVEELDRVQYYDIFGKNIPFFMAYIKALSSTRPRKMVLSVDSHVSVQNISEIVVGNGNTLGGEMRFSDSADITDGEVDYLVAVDKGPAAIMSILIKMIKGEVEAVRNKTISGTCSSVLIKSFDGSNLSFNLDGEIVKGGSEWQIDVINRGLNIVVPKEVLENN